MMTYLYVGIAEGRKEGCIDGLVMGSHVGKLDIDGASVGKCQRRRCVHESYRSRIKKNNC